MPKIILPLDFVSIDHNSYHIFIPCTINNIECEMLVDTGASRSVFDMGFISEAASDVSFDEIMTSGIGPGSIDARPGTLEMFSVGNRVWTKVNVMFMDLSHINTLYNKVSSKRIAGLIGGDFLMNTKACLDYGKSCIRLSIPAKYVPKF